MHGGGSQCMHGRGISLTRAFGYSPSFTGMISIHFMDRLMPASSGSDGGTLFSAWHAVTHPSHAVHLSKSITIPHLGISLFLLVSSLWSLVSSLWSLVSGLWSPVSSLWTSIWRLETRD